MVKKLFKFLFNEIVTQKEPAIVLSEFDYLLLRCQYPNLKSIILKYQALNQGDELMEFLFGIELSEPSQQTNQ